ncbi:MAG: histidine kinase, partial [Cellulomonas sp.]
VFVRDRGDGFDLADVPSDRFGVRESIIGRVTRRGGTASVRSDPERGTEVHLTIPVDGPGALVDGPTASARAATEGT